MELNSSVRIIDGITSFDRNTAKDGGGEEHSYEEYIFHYTRKRSKVYINLS